MKRLFSFFIALVMLFSLTACKDHTSDTLNIDESLYTPHCLTVTLYDAANSIYGFTWNTDAEPFDAVLQVCAGSEFNEKSASVYKADVEAATELFVCKARAALSAGTTYTYRVYDTKAKVGSEVFTITARDPQVDSFTFVHLSDSQVDIATAGAGGLLGAILDVMGSDSTDIDFLLHTGDIVQNGGSESDWRNMLDPNAAALCSMPFMAISGNHDSEYSGQDYNLYKHFDVKKPEQNCLAGYYYSFDYANARFIMLDTNSVGEDNKLLPDQYNWLVSTLESNTKQWTIVAMHNPVYSVGKYGANPDLNQIALALQEQLNDLFVQHRVDLVLQGHDHAYSYTYPITTGNMALKDTVIENNCFINPQGVVYAMHGPAGNQVRAPHSKETIDLYKYTATSAMASWAEITIAGNTLTVNVMSNEIGSPETMFRYGIIKQ